MIERFVIMKFKPESNEEFLRLFDEKREKISSFQGCSHLELKYSVQHKNWYMTYSIWENESALNQYRESELFGSVWKKVKILFNAPPEAISINLSNESDLQKKIEFIAKFEGNEST